MMYKRAKKMKYRVDTKNKKQHMDPIEVKHCVDMRVIEKMCLRVFVCVHVCGGQTQ